MRRQTRSKTLRDFRLHRHETLLYTLGAMDQWAWEVRLVDRQDGSSGDDTPVCVDGRGATPPEYCGDPTGDRLMVKRQALGDTWCPPAEIETVIGMLAAAHPDRPASTWELLRSALDEGCQSLDRRLEQSGPLAPERFSLREVNERLNQRPKSRRFA